MFSELGGRRRRRAAWVRLAGVLDQPGAAGIEGRDVALSRRWRAGPRYLHGSRKRNLHRCGVGRSAQGDPVAWAGGTGLNVATAVDRNQGV